jgi:hypothetical protein
MPIPTLISSLNQNSNSTIIATTENGTKVNLSITGSINSTQMSDITLTTNQTAASTILSFTLTGQSGTAGVSFITVPKSAVPYGTTPEIYIDNQPAQTQSYAQDTNNYYLYYTTHFSKHQISIVFTPSSSTSPTTSPNQTSAQPSLIQAVYGATAGAAIVVIVVVALKVTIDGRRHKNSFLT